MRVGVIGAGMTGLVAAYRLAQAGHECIVYERWPGLGGQVATLEVDDGVRLERYYHHLFSSDRHIAELYDELGIEPGIEWIPSSVAVFANGRSHPFTSPIDLLRFPAMSFGARVRMGVTALRLQRSRKGVDAYESVTAATWIRENMGEEAWSAVWGPLLRGKFGDRAEDISMAWIWSKLNLRRQIKGREARQELLGYPAGSWEPLLTRLQAEIESRGGQVLIDRPARRLSRAGSAFRVSPAAPASFRRGHDPGGFEPGGPEDEFDAIVATVPSDVFVSLLDDELVQALGPDYIGRLEATEYHAAVCLLLELSEQFSPFYWTNIADIDLPFVGLIEQTNLIPPERYGGRRFLYVANYVAPGDPLLDLDMDGVIRLYEPGLRKVNPRFTADWIERSWLFREPGAQPIVTVGYHERIPPLRTPAPGLVLANTTQIYPEDRGTNYSVRLGEDAADALLAQPG